EGGAVRAGSGRDQRLSGRPGGGDGDEGRLAAGLGRPHRRRLSDQLLALTREAGSRAGSPLSTRVVLLAAVAVLASLACPAGVSCAFGASPAERIAVCLACHGAGGVSR